MQKGIWVRDMSEVKWVKLTTDMFSNSKIKQLRRLPEGNNIVLIWVALLTMAGRCNANGMIILTENVPYTEEMLADELDFELPVVTLAIEALRRFNMINTDEGCFVISNWTEYQSIAGLDAIREYERQKKAKYRRQKRFPEIEEEKCPRNVHGLSTLSSYSYSNNSNISNLLKVLEEYKDNDYINTNIKLLDCIKAWMEYKDGRKPKSSNHYNSKVGIERLLSSFIKNDKEFGTDEVIRVVDESMACNYAGIIWDKCRKTGGNTGGCAKSDAERYEQKALEYYGIGK